MVYVVALMKKQEMTISNCNHKHAPQEICPCIGYPKHSEVGRRKLGLDEDLSAQESTVSLQ